MYSSFAGWSIALLLLTSIYFIGGLDVRADGKKIKHVAINEKLQAENDRKNKKVPSHFHSDAFLSPSRFFLRPTREWAGRGGEFRHEYEV